MRYGHCGTVIAVGRLGMMTASLLVWLASLWLYAGAAVAVLFLLYGIGRVDESARGSFSFRPLLVPGILLLWPLVLWRWWKLESGWDPSGVHYRAVRRAHGWAWLVLGVAIPALLISAMLYCQHWPSGSAPVQLEAVSQEVSQ